MLKNNQIFDNLRIETSKLEDAKVLQKIQENVFQEDLKLYKNEDNCPANEKVENIERKILSHHSFYYSIILEDKIVGGFDVRIKKDETHLLHRIYICADEQNKGLGKQVMKMIENEFSKAKTWILDTPHLNKRNQHFYESLGFKKIGESVVNEHLTLFDYKKEII